MTTESKTPPKPGQKQAEPRSATALATASAVEKTVQGTAEAARTAERHLPEDLVATALKDISSAEHLTKQIEEISKGTAERMGAGWVDGLGTSYATDLAGGLGVSRLAPDISERMQEALGIASSFKSPALDVAGLADAGLASQRLAKQLSD